MTQPDFVPILDADRVRPTDRLAVPDPWWADRVAEIRTLTQPQGEMFGTNGPDQGYALCLAERFDDQLVLSDGESASDVRAGGTATALRRAAHFGRAPVIYDLRWAFEVWGVLGNAPQELVTYRMGFFAGCAHDYLERRTLASRVAADSLVLGPGVVRDRVSSGQWRGLFVPA